MKSCYYCGGRKTSLVFINDKLTVKCNKCGIEISTPYLTTDSARGYWNMKMSELEARKKAAAV